MLARFDQLVVGDEFTVVGSDREWCVRGEFDGRRYNSITCDGRVEKVTNFAPDQEVTLGEITMRRMLSDATKVLNKRCTIRQAERAWKAGLYEQDLDIDGPYPTPTQRYNDMWDELYGSDDDE